MAHHLPARRAEGIGRVDLLDRRRFHARPRAKRHRGQTDRKISSTFDVSPMPNQMIISGR
jgi:hypothetical protein